MSQGIDTATVPRVCRDFLQTAPQGLYRLPGLRFAWRVYDTTTDQWHRVVLQRRFAYVDPKGTVPPEVHGWVRLDGIIVAEQWLTAENLCRRSRVRFRMNELRWRLRSPFVRPDKLPCKILNLLRKKWIFRCGSGEFTVITPIAGFSAAKNGYDARYDSRGSWLGLYLGVKWDHNSWRSIPGYALSWVRSWPSHAPR